MRNLTNHTPIALLGGVLFWSSLIPSGIAFAATLTTLHTFGYGPGLGYDPSGVVADAAGNLYGATSSGGRSILTGVLFELAPDGTETVLKEFGPRGDASILLLDASGVLYGTLTSGLLYKQPLGGVFKPFFPFRTAASGTTPSGGVTEDAAGNLYGTTQTGGIGISPTSGGYGTIYKSSPTAQLTTLYKFTGGLDGSSPIGGVVADATGHLFGTAAAGGTANLGTVFKLEPSGRLKVLHSFTGGADGKTPDQPLLRDSANNLIGATAGGGSGHGGIVFKVSPAGKETVLHAFGTGTDGRQPSSALVADQGGNLYGTTTYGGASDAGTVYKLSPDGAETLLYEFKGGADGEYPTGGLVLKADGTIIGATLSGEAGGTVYELTP